MTEREFRSEDETFIVRMESYEGPIDALLDLARSQRFDLEQIDMIKLVDQFEAILIRAITLRIEMAADWLVMASWLAYLKSKNLLKTPKEAAEEPDADSLAYHLKRLNAVRTVTAAIGSRRQVGIDWFAPGMHRETTDHMRDGGSLHELLASYHGAVERSNITNEVFAPVSLKPFDIASVAESISLLTRSISGRDWTNLLELVPPSTDGGRLKSNIASHLVAALEMTRDGKMSLDQAQESQPVMVRDAEMPR
jgi:segregation and condensation protein A